MPARNMLPILYPKKSPNDLSDMLNDLVEIYVKGLGTAPSSGSLQKAIDDQWSACDIITNANKKRECIKKALDLENKKDEVISKERDLGAADIEKFINKRINDAEYYFANDPFSFVEATRGLYRKAFEEMNTILDSVPQRDYKNYTDMDRFEKLLGDYKDKTEDLTLVSNAMKTQNEGILKYYGVFYNTSPVGITKMEVSNTTKQPTGAKPTNIKTKEGLPVYVIDPQPLEDTPIKKAILGNKELTFIKPLGKFQIPEPETFDWDLVKKRIVSSVSWGDFAQDSEGNKYFATKEGKLAPVSEDVFRMLGGNENKILKMTSWEEENDLPKLRVEPIKPPSQKIERLIEESASMEYEAEKAKRTPLLRAFGMRGLFRERPTAPMPTMEEIRAGLRGRYGIERVLPPKEPEAIRGRTEEIFKGELK